MPLVASTIAGAAIITPVLVVFWRSFTSGRLGFDVGLNLANYARVFNDKDIMPMLSNSVVYAAGAALLGTALGALLAWIVARTNTPGKALGGTDAALSDLDADDHEEHRLDSVAGAQVGHFERHAAAVLGHRDIWCSTLSAWLA